MDKFYIILLHKINYQKVLAIKNTVRFFSSDPTNQGYELEWEQPDEDLIPNLNKVFKCQTPKGIIYPGIKFEMVFEYIPNSL